jgi:predicted flap endonuclease-1-like 5' DNA nuclease
VKLYSLGELFAVPLQSAIKAQNLALQETLSFIEQFGIEQQQAGAEKGMARTLRFKAERTVEERTIDPETGSPQTQLVTQPLEISIPLLAILPPPNIQLQEMNVEFGVEVVEPKKETLESSVLPATVTGVSLAPSLAMFSPLGPSNPTTMKVNMKIVRETPEGMARLGDLLTDLLSAQAIATRPPGVSKPPEPQPTPPPVARRLPSPPVDKISGIGPRTSEVLAKHEVFTVGDFLAATETAEKVKALAEALNISEKRITEWHEQAKLIEKGQE